MIRVLLLRLEAPLMAFGGPIVDSRGVAARFPGLAMLTGLFANALGWEHRDWEALNALQARLRFAARIDRAGVLVTDFQTVDLGAKDVGWTTRGRAEGRAGAAATYNGPHLRYRQYWADAAVTVAVTLNDTEAAPTLDDLAAALDEPARPLFIGRKPCLPSRRLLVGAVEAPTLLAAFADGRAQVGTQCPTQWPDGEPDGDDRAILRLISDRRDWGNQIHTGQRRVREGML